MKYIGIDFGIKRIGIAISDDEGKIAFPLQTILNNMKRVDNISCLIKEEKIETIIIGESLNLKGEKNKIEKEIEKFIDCLKQEIKIPIKREKEFFSSYEAHGRKGKEERNTKSFFHKKTNDLDASSASLILQRYLDRINNLNKK